ALSRAQAAEKVNAVLRDAANFAAVWQVKKIDSTLRGTLAEESDQPRVLIIDAEEDEQLDEVIAAVASRARQALLVGSAGICEALARYLRRDAAGPLLAVV
ncbi:hypothetical protein CJ207_27945, partial [Klebsiella aerogenes]